MALFRYTYEAKHTELGKYRIVSGTDDAVVRAKGAALLATWEAEYKRKLEKDRLIAEREAKKDRLIEERDAALEKSQQQKEKAKEELENNLQAAEDRTDEATEALEQVTDTLHNGLSADHEVDWGNLKRRDSYPEPKPAHLLEYLKFPREPQPDDRRYNNPPPEKLILLPEKPILLPEDPIPLECPPEPQPDSPKYQPVVTLSFLDKMLNRAEMKTQAAKHELYLQDYAAWSEIEAVRQRRAEAARQNIIENQRRAEAARQNTIKNQRRAEAARQNTIKNQHRVEAARQNDIAKQRRAKDLFLQEHEAWAKDCQQIQLKNETLYSESVVAIEAWNTAAAEYSVKQDQENAAIDTRKAQYESLVPDAVSDYCELVLSASEYPDSFPKEFELEYISGTKILVVDYSLPAPEHLPRVKEVKYVKAKDDMVEVFLSETELNRIYDGVLYQICLRTIHELFDADVANALSAVVFNGWVKSIDKATGKEVNGCVISVQTTKEEFQKIALANVDPKACFKTLKGIGSSKLHSLTPIAPVLKINREDKRFIASYAVAGQLDERTNLAAMDWEDFEHLIRELFEKEFSKPGCEVKVTQASRDGGVDSVVLDSDPIHGGKTVIQAKRYTNTVGVAAVRELWGTVLNEGAMKGILVTTADYGPDAYEFAKGKPLVLLNGANLLHLLEKHGHKAKIDIQEAKRILAEKEA